MWAKSKATTTFDCTRSVLYSFLSLVNCTMHVINFSFSSFSLTLSQYLYLFKFLLSFKFYFYIRVIRSTFETISILLVINVLNLCNRNSFIYTLWWLREWSFFQTFISIPDTKINNDYFHPILKKKVINVKNKDKYR